MDTEKKSKNYYFFRHQKGYCENDIIRRVMNKAENETLADQYGFICTLITEYAIPKRGTIYFKGTEDTIEEQIAFDIRRNVSLVKEVWKWWTKYGGIEKVNKAEYKIKGLFELTESRTEKADYMKEYRESRENKAATEDCTNANNYTVTEKSNNVTAKSNAVTIVESDIQSKKKSKKETYIQSQSESEPYTIPTLDMIIDFVSSACGLKATPTVIDYFDNLLIDTTWEAIENWKGFIRSKVIRDFPKYDSNDDTSEEAPQLTNDGVCKDNSKTYTDKQRELLSRGIKLPSFEEFLREYERVFEELTEHGKHDLYDYWEKCDWEAYWENAGVDGWEFAATNFWNSRNADE